MQQKLNGAFLDFQTVGPEIDTRSLDRVLDMKYYPYSKDEELLDRLEDRQVAIVNKTRLSRPTLTAARDLKLIVVSATGTDNVDVAAARDLGIAVANVRDYCSAAVVQHVFALVLGLTQQIVRFDTLVRSGAWQRSRSFTLFDYPIRELAGRKLGIVGYGALGQAVGRAGQCLGMQLLISARPGTPPRSVPDGRVAFDTVVAESDVLSLHCPLTDQTRHMISTRQLARMKSDALLINTSRGALIDTDALIQALKDGQIAGAGIDVLPVEPPPPAEQALLADAPSNLIVTPHIAWAAKEARQRALDQVAENIADFINGGTLRRVE